MSSHDDPTAKAGMNDRDIEETMARFRAGLARMAEDPAEGARVRTLGDNADLDVLAQTIREDLRESEAAQAREGEETEPLPARQAEPALIVAGRDATAVHDAADGTDELTVRKVAALATRAHRGQTLSSGGPWSGHLRVVAE